MKPEEVLLTAKDVREVAGMSYRKINDWDERGSLPHQREHQRQWRRFSPNHVFQLMICHELQTKFGVPKKRLKWILDFMGQEGANHFKATLRLMSILGLEVWLLTDFEDTFILDSELELADLTQLGFFGGEDKSGFIMLKVSPLANRLLKQLEGKKLSSNRRAEGLLFELNQVGREAVSSKEQAALTAIRTGDYRSVEVLTKDGQITTIRKTEDLDLSTDFNQAIGELPYQRLTVVTRAGNPISVERQHTERPK